MWWNNGDHFSINTYGASRFRFQNKISMGHDYRFPSGIFHVIRFSMNGVLGRYLEGVLACRYANSFFCYFLGVDISIDLHSFCDGRGVAELCRTQIRICSQGFLKYVACSFVSYCSFGGLFRFRVLPIALLVWSWLCNLSFTRDITNQSAL